DLHNLNQLVGSEFEAVDLIPVVSGLDQNSGSTAGGATITITGLNFSGGAGQMHVFFGSVPASTVAIVSDSQLTATVPPQVGGTVDVVVQSPYGTSAKGAADRYTYGQSSPSSNQAFVAQVYLDLLQRPADAGGLASWTGLLDQGMSRPAVVQAMESSAE